MNSRNVRAWTRYAIAAALVIVVLSPALWLVLMSLRPNTDIMATTLAFRPTLHNYAEAWTGEFPASFGHSLSASLASTVVSLLVGVPAAYVLARWRFRGQHQVAMWILVTRMAPPIAFTIPFFLGYTRLGLMDTVAGLALIYVTFNLALVIWTMKGFFDAVPRSLEEAAWIDGAASGILCFILSWNDFFFALILTRTEAMTAPVAIVNFMQYAGFEWGKIAAGGVSVMLPVLLFTVLVRRYLVSGLTAGGVKE